MKMKKMVVSFIACAILAACLVGCSAEKVYYEDENYTITGFAPKEEGNIQELIGTVQNKSDVYVEAFMIDVTLYDANGDEVMKTFGIAPRIPADGKADLLIGLVDDNGLLSKKEAESIVDYKLENPFALAEGLK